MTVEMYSKDNCVYCVAAKNLLDARGIPFVLHHMEGDYHTLFEKTGGMTFPQILIDGQVIGGFTELRALDKAGKLA